MSETGVIGSFLNFRTVNELPFVETISENVSWTREPSGERCVNERRRERYLPVCLLGDLEDETVQFVARKDDVRRHAPVAPVIDVDRDADAVAADVLDMVVIHQGVDPAVTLETAPQVVVEDVDPVDGQFRREPPYDRHRFIVGEVDLILFPGRVEEDDVTYVLVGLVGG